MKINFISPLPNYNIYKKYNYVSCESNKQVQNYNLDLPKYYFPSQIMFCANYSSNKERVQSIGLENFPNEKIAQIFIDSPNDKSLHDVHLEFYKPLLECKSLDEAKKLYPEFSNVIELSQVPKENIPSYSRIKAGRYEGMNIDNFSLELLKRYYGEAHSVGLPKYYSGMAKRTLNTIFKLVNIDKMKFRYVNAVVQSSDQHKKILSEAQIEKYKDPEFREKMSRIRKEAWDNDDGTRRKKQSKWTKEHLHTPEVEAKVIARAKSEENRARVSENKKKFWANMDDEMRQEYAQRALDLFQTPEMKERRRELFKTEDYRKKVSKGVRKFNKEHPEYNEARKEAWERHPEIKEAIEGISKEPFFFDLKDIIKKKEDGMPITEDEERKYRYYWQRCQEAAPNMGKIIGEEFHNILVEKGLKEE